MPSPNIIVSEVSPQMEADPDDFSRRLKISPTSPVLRMHGLLRTAVRFTIQTWTPCGDRL